MKMSQGAPTHDDFFCQYNSSPCSSHSPALIESFTVLMFIVLFVKVAGVEGKELWGYLPQAFIHTPPMLDT